MHPQPLSLSVKEGRCKNCAGLQMQPTRLLLVFTVFLPSVTLHSKRKLRRYHYSPHLDMVLRQFNPYTPQHSLQFYGRKMFKSKNHRHSETKQKSFKNFHTPCHFNRIVQATAIGVVFVKYKTQHLHVRRKI
jgi:hypothetical protein